MAVSAGHRIGLAVPPEARPPGFGGGESESVIAAFERQVDSGPERNAIRRPDGDTAACGARAHASFGELDAHANAIAWHLIRRRGSRSEPVALAICDPALMLASALGVLKAGKFFAALNPLHPASHFRRLLSQLDPPLLLCDGRGQTVAARGSHASLVRGSGPRGSGARGSSARENSARMDGLRASGVWASGPPSGGVRAQSVEEIVAADALDGRPELRFDESRLAYVLYTSGSTGRPRGVAQTRRDMLHNVVRHRPLNVAAGDCVSLLSADGFVASISNPYVALLNGAALAPYSFRDEGADRMMGWLQRARVTLLYAFPSFLRLLAAAEQAHIYGGMRLAYLGGETVLASDLRQARRLFPAATLSVGLNSSETGLTCLHTIAPGEALPDPVPVGRPVADVQLSIIREDGGLALPGTPGEIAVRSKYVNPRYWPSKPAHRREPPVDARTPQANTRRTPQADTLPTSPAGLFHTGDRGRVDADGLVYHLGRTDTTVKVRGFRVDVAEVEAAIAVLDTVAEVGVVGVPGCGEDSAALELTACLVVRGRTPHAVAVRRAVARTLPDAMIPTRVLFFDALPRTPNGKLDRNALARAASGLSPCTDGTPPAVPHTSAQLTAANVRPAAHDAHTGETHDAHTGETPDAHTGETPDAHAGEAHGTHAGEASDAPRQHMVEQRIARIWASVLKLEDLSGEADFFLLGGTSIDAVAVIARVRRELGVRIPLAALFRAPTVSALAKAVSEERARQAPRSSESQRSSSWLASWSSSSDPLVRIAHSGDLASVCAIVNHYIQHSTFNFHREPQTIDEWIDEWSATQNRYPWLVAVAGGSVAGVAYAGPWKHRAAYDWCSEVSVYVSHRLTHRGIGAALYSRLLHLLDQRHFRTQIAVIALPNEPSVALHEAFSFRFAGALKHVGFKHGQWLDVGFWQRTVSQGGQQASVPDTPVPDTPVPDTPVPDTPVPHTEAANCAQSLAGTSEAVARGANTGGATHAHR